MPHSASALAYPDDALWHASRRRLTPLSTQAHLSDLLQAMGMGTHAPLSRDAEVPVPVWCVREGAVLFHEGAPTDSLFVVRSGSLKSVKFSEDGYNQVIAFAGPGEVMGFESLHRGVHRNSALAMELSTVFALPVRGLDSRRQQSPALDMALQMAISRQLDGAGDIAELMAAVAADVRLARFLLWMSQRFTASGHSPLRFQLRMCRRDVASLLGVAHETVSRSFSNLAAEGLIRVLNRDITILDRVRLMDKARCTRGLSEGPQAASTLRPTVPSADAMQRSASPFSGTFVSPWAQCDEAAQRASA
jgi:CRP/FNR family transcriptional regulator